MSVQLGSSGVVNPHPHINESLHTKKFPIQLASRVQDQFLLQILVDKNGSLFGTVTEGNLSYKLSLKGFKATPIEPSHVENALALMSKSHLFFDGYSILLTPKLMGGGCTQSSLDDSFNYLPKALNHSDKGDRALRERNLPKAIEEYTRSVELMVKHYGENGPILPAALNELGACHLANLDYALALGYFSRSQEITKRETNEEDKGVTKQIAALTPVVANIDRYKKALKLLEEGESNFGKDRTKIVRPIEEALELFREIVGENHPIIQRSLTTLGSAHMVLDSFQDALECYEQAQEVHKNLNDGREDPDLATLKIDMRGLIPNQELLKRSHKRSAENK